ncbi:MAG: ABC transporter permease [Eubacteriaceae bacterium]|nr:ABC transporter permease [Eubacteriaceae bacterium]
MKNPFILIKENIVNTGRTFEMSFKELEKRYSGAALGAVWAMVKPMLFIAVYWFAIDVGIRGGGDDVTGYPFILWLISGIIPWFFISETLVYGGTSLRQNKHLITKLVYPISTIPTFRVLSQMYVHLAMTIVTMVLFIFAGVYPTVYYFQLIYYNVALFIFMTVVSWTTSALVVVSRDFEHLLKSVTQMLFWLTPILWHLSNVKGFLKLVIMANPIYYFVKGYRDTFLTQEWFFENWHYSLYFWGLTIVIALIGAFIFNKLKNELADIL